MNKSLIALALVGAFTAPVFAEEAAPTPEHSVTGNLGLFSSYRFRGIDQTFGKPALQGGFDYAHASGLYAGNWNSNVSEYAGYPGGNLEMDFYGGYKKTLGDFGLDVGGLYYYYPGSDAGFGRAVDNFELYAAVSWKFLTFKYSHALTNYFDLSDSKNTGYYDLGAAYDLGNGWGINGHVGYTDVRNHSANSYADWKLGVTKDINGFVVGLAYVGTDADKDIYSWSNTGNGKSIFAGKNTAVFSVSKTF